MHPPSARVRSPGCAFPGCATPGPGASASARMRLARVRLPRCVFLGPVFRGHSPEQGPHARSSAIQHLVCMLVLMSPNN
ncbi:hypothetical protein E2562_028222 [Oryza meyeriana var. granulata]|uniref:Uncharacterized protein n=1 Tax=Oryza meyeriana var. granulata TaxID=110450 RepID=A0A6G1DQ56_9ORYZ|nr:hypothetical protein E2562_028222 [Oryza meyeriana var. granulata]